MENEKLKSVPPLKVDKDEDSTEADRLWEEVHESYTRLKRKRLAEGG